MKAPPPYPLTNVLVRGALDVKSPWSWNRGQVQGWGCGTHQDTAQLRYVPQFLLWAVTTIKDSQVDSHCCNTGATHSAPRLSACVKSRQDGPSAMLEAYSILVQTGAHGPASIRASSRQGRPASSSAETATSSPHG